MNDSINKLSGRKIISIVVPVMNEQEAIYPFLNCIKEELHNINYDIEVVFVDDGSKDKTLLAIKSYPMCGNITVRCIKLSRNFGKEAAMTAGLDYAKGDAVIPMDVDLQDPPEVIHLFIKKWEEGFDTVYGVRNTRRQDSHGKRASAGCFYKIFNKISDTPIPQNAGDFRLMDRKVVDAIKMLPEKNRFMKGLFAWPGFSSIGIGYDRPARSRGETKFNGWKLWNFAVDGITSFSTWPLRMWSYIGGGIALISLIYMLFIVTRTIILGVEWPGYASIMSAVLFLGAIQLISIGILGEYIGRLYLESKHRPTYLVDTEL